MSRDNSSAGSSSKSKGSMYWRLRRWVAAITGILCFAGVTYFIMAWTSQKPLSIRVVKVTRQIDDSQKVLYEIKNTSAFPVYFVADYGIRGVSQMPGAYGAVHDLTLTQGLDIPTPLLSGASFTVTAFADKRTRFQDYDCSYRYSWVPTSQRYLRGFRVWSARFLPKDVLRHISPFEGSRHVETRSVDIASPEKGVAYWSVDGRAR